MYMFVTQPSESELCNEKSCTHGGDGVQRVLDGQQQDLVSAGGVVCIGGSGDPLACGEVKKCLLVSNVHRFTGSTRHTAISALHAVELHQGLPLERHHHHVTANTEVRECRPSGDHQTCYWSSSEGEGLISAPSGFTLNVSRATKHGTTVSIKWTRSCWIKGPSVVSEGGDPWT